MQPPRGPRRMRRRQANCASMSSKSSPGPCPPPGKHRVTRRPHWLGSLRALTSLEGHDQLRQGLHGRPGLFLIQLRHRPPFFPQRHLVPLMEVCSRALPRSPADSARQRQQHPLHVPSLREPATVRGDGRQGRYATMKYSAASICRHRQS